jgi:probable F420-dependent oxidoreductase
MKRKPRPWSSDTDAMVGAAEQAAPTDSAARRGPLTPSEIRILAGFEEVLRMRVETGIPTDDWRKVAEAAVRAEAAGYQGLVTADIVGDPFIPLGIAATATEQIGLGTGIVVAFPRSPMAIAQVAWDLHAQSGGRFHLGLGSQVKGHIERRFATPWTAPVPRMREYVESLRAIWNCWEHGEKLDYQGEHYRFSLMTPEFSPKPNGLAPIRVSIAAVGPAMLKLAGRICDGVRLHGFATRKYIEEVALPQVASGLEASGRKRDDFEVWGGGFIATGETDEEVAKEMDWVRYRLAFYGSTRSYHGVLACHDELDLGMKLHAMSKRGEWNQMAAEISDDLVRIFAAVGRHDELPAAIAARFEGVSDTVALGFAGPTPSERVREILADIRAIPARFNG